MDEVSQIPGLVTFKSFSFFKTKKTIYPFYDDSPTIFI